MLKTESQDSARLTTQIVEGILKRKGQKVKSLDLTKLANGVCDFFVICHGNSKPQVEAIADSVMEEVRKGDGVNPWHKEGFENAEWILLDYVNVVVHIFTEKTRAFYNLEGLWADAQIKEYSDDNPEGIMKP